MKNLLCKLFLLTLVYFVGGHISHAATEAEYSNGFITTWKTNNPGVTASNQIRIPTTGGGYNYDVDWGDGTFTNGLTGTANHTYGAPGTYTVRIAGTFPQIFFNSGGDRRKILSIQHWGTQQWRSMSYAFSAAENLTITATDTPNLSNATSLSNMFFSTFAMNSNLNSWDVSTITDMSGMFGNNLSFNQPLNNWNVSSVTDMSGMFANAGLFNQPLNNWDVSSVTTMSDMFSTAVSFNQNISTWNTSSVTNMGAMFQDAASYNQPMYAWNTSNVTNMTYMFNGATSFNQTLYAWDTSNVTSMDNMFDNATSFSQSLGSWNISLLTTALNMFDGSGLSTGNYDSTLNGWSIQTPQNGVSLGALGVEYCNVTAHDTLTNTYGWTITDDGVTTCDTAPPVLSAISTTVSTSSAVISFTSDEPATSTISYGLTTGYGTDVFVSPATTTTTSTITELTPNTLYYYLVTSQDSSLNTSTSSGSFTTSALPVVVVPVVVADAPVVNRVSYGSSVPTYSSPTQPVIVFNGGVCAPYLIGNTPIKVGGNNDAEEVKKIQTFLNEYEKTNLVVDGVYKLVDEQAIKVFQAKYLTQVLSPWGLFTPTGIVHTTTRAKMNALVCGKNLGCPVFTQKTDGSSTHGDVVKVKNLLNQILGLKLNTQTAVVDPATTRAISTFQTKYKDFILKPLGLKNATGLWYESTIKQANAFMGCTL